MKRPARKCPTCRGAVPQRPENAAWPFCSDKCRLSDLGRWLDEDYCIAGERAGDGGGGDPPAEEQEEGT